MATHVFTSIATNYIPKARVLANSLKTFHPDYVFHIVLCDAVPVWFDITEEPFDSVLTINDLGIEQPESWIFKHSIVELSTAVKGFALRRLLQKPGCEQVLYFDPDMVILSPLNGLINEFGSSSSIFLTPHIAEPEKTIDAILDNEFSVLQHGIYNLGFIGVKNSAEGVRFADWWADRLYHFCYDDIPHGIFTDQRWIDLAPAYFSQCKILRDPIYNVCTWNLTHRDVTGSFAEGFHANERPIVFYHFSGFDSGAQELMLNKYGKQMPALYELRDWYIAECERMGQSELSEAKWSYGFYENGERISNGHRKLYRERADLQQAFPNPFITSTVSRSYLHWLIASDEAPDADGQAFDHNDGLIPDYRIVVLAMREDIPYLRGTLDTIAQRAVRKNDVVVMFGAHEGSVAGMGLEERMATDCRSYDALFSTAINRFKDRDLFIVRAGVLISSKCDLRLAWSTRRQLGIATASPLEANTLKPPSNAGRRFDLEIIDALCYLHRSSAGKESGYFSTTCVFLRSEALRAIENMTVNAAPTYLLDAFARARFSHVLATHVCVADERPAAVLQVHNDLTDASTRNRIRGQILSHAICDAPQPPSVVAKMMKATLHIMHSWGGGLERWVNDYCRHDSDREHFILKSSGSWLAFGSELQLFQRSADTRPIEVWQLTPAIKATTGSDTRYADILNQIRKQYDIGRIIISSLVGHSIEALRQPVPTIFVCHEYYPFCPALNIRFETVCKSCDDSRLALCTQENPLNFLFRNVPALEWSRLRREFISAANQHSVAFVAPSFSLRRQYTELAPELKDRFTVIEHGSESFPEAPLCLQFESVGRLRLLVLGRLSPNKGGALFERILPELLGFADVLLVGCGEHGSSYANREGITAIPNYDLAKLPKLLSSLQPELALLLSIVPESYSYTLQELRELAVPTLALRLGSFVDRIEDNLTGFLCDPDPDTIVARIRALSEKRTTLSRIHNNLKSLAHRSVREMLRDYEKLVPAPYSVSKYFASRGETRRIQLYWRTKDSEYQEENSSKVSFFDEARQVVTLAIPKQTGILQGLRLNFFPERSLFFLHDITVRDLTGGIVWQWNRTADLFRTAQVNQLVAAGPIYQAHSSSEEGVLLYLSGKDAFLVLPLTATELACLNQGGCVAVDSSERSIKDEMPGIVGSLSRTAADQSAEIERLSQTLHGVLGSISWRMTKPARLFMQLGRKLKRGVGV